MGLANHFGLRFGIVACITLLLVADRARSGDQSREELIPEDTCVLELVLPPIVASRSRAGQESTAIRAIVSVVSQADGWLPENPAEGTVDPNERTTSCSPR